MKLDKISLTPPPIVAVIVLMSVMASAETKILRIADKGTGDGSSWDAPMGSISNALAKADQMVKAGECGHVELWIKKGRYYAAGMNTYTLRTYLPSEVTFRGGFIGTETSADKADPAANPTYISGDKGFDSVWQRNGSTQVNIWKDASTLQLPNPDHTDMYWNTFRGGAGYDVNYGFIYSGAVSNICFNGIIFVVYGQAAISPADDDATADNVLITNCTFVACGTCARLRGFGNRAIDCSFYGNGNGVTFPPSERPGLPRFATVTRCLFEENHGGGTLLATGTSSTLSVSNCVFRHNCVRNVSGQLYNLSAVGATNRLFDCQFVSNRVTAAGKGLISVDSSVYQNDAIASLDRCQFIDNVATGTTSAAAVCLYDGSLYRDWTLRDCLFLRNRDISDKADITRSSIACQANQAMGFFFYNCAFVSNSVTATGSNAGAATLSVGGGMVSARYYLVNCVFKDSALACGAGGQAAEIRWPYPTTNGRCTAVNTIFDNEAPDYQPYYFTEKGVADAFAFVDVACYHPEGIDASSCSVLGNRLKRWSYAITEKPVYSGFRTGPNGLVSFGVASRPASVTRKTIEVFINEDGGYRAYDPDYKPAAPFFTFYGFYGTGETAAKAKVTPDSPLLPDAFGRPRKAGKVALGPLNAPDPGLMLLLR